MPLAYPSSLIFWVSFLVASHVVLLVYSLLVLMLAGRVLTRLRVTRQQSGPSVLTHLETGLVRLCFQIEIYTYCNFLSWHCWFSINSSFSQRTTKHLQQSWGTVLVMVQKPFQTMVWDPRLFQSLVVMIKLWGYGSAINLGTRKASQLVFYWNTVLHMSSRTRHLKLQGKQEILIFVIL